MIRALKITAISVLVCGFAVWLAPFAWVVFNYAVRAAGGY